MTSKKVLHFLVFSSLFITNISAYLELHFGITLTSILITHLKLFNMCTVEAKSFLAFYIFCPISSLLSPWTSRCIFVASGIKRKIDPFYLFQMFMTQLHFIWQPFVIISLAGKWLHHFVNSREHVFQAFHIKKNYKQLLSFTSV